MHTANPDPRTSPAVARRPVRQRREDALRPELRIKRAYETRDVQQDGQRILVDRLWPRGLSRLDLADAVWIRDVAPSTGLRQWFGHRPQRWAEFRRRYFAELRANPAVQTLRELIAAGPSTLIYSAKDERHNQAVALAEFLQDTAPPAEETNR
jgi:uncharacterized protein YeaO (DUF488 family)